MTETLTTATPSDLSTCEGEPISVLEAIQPHGCLLVCALPSWIVQAVSVNTGAILGRDARHFLGRMLDTVLPDKTVHDLRNVLQAAMMSGGTERLLNQPIDDGPERYDLTIHMAAANAVVDIIPRKGAEALTADPIVLVKSMIGRLRRAPTLERCLQLAASQVRAVTGYDRVVVYKFLPDGSGQVVAEALRSGLPPFRGLCYSASEIPAEARALYRRQWLRMVPDVAQSPVALITHSGCEADLSLSTLRSPSPICREYPSNMDPAATLTISVLVGEALWGLIACHHGAPRRVSSSTCAVAELFGQIFSLQIEAREQAQKLALAAQPAQADEVSP